MSIQLINDLPGYARLLKGIEMLHAKELAYVQRGFESDDQIAAHLWQLHALNIMSWNARYKENEPIAPDMDSFIKSICRLPVKSPHVRIESVLHSLEYLDYQIEVPGVELSAAAKASLKWLKQRKDRCITYLLNKYTNYAKEDWSL